MNPDRETALAATHAARVSYGRLVALLAARGAGLADAEDALSEAFAVAIAQWPRDGVPANPDAWLYSVARRKQIDAGRRRATATDQAERLGIMLTGLAADVTDGALPDRRLGLLFACADPAIDPGFRTALMLNVVIGLTAAEIAPLYLVGPKTMSQRLTRGKARIKESGVSFAVPEADAIGERLPAVLDAVYASYTRGYGDEIGSGALAQEAVFLARITADLVDDAESWGLLSMILHTQARTAARRADDGSYVPYDAQDTDRWDVSLVTQAEQALARANGKGPTGRFQIEAAIQSARAAERLSAIDTRSTVLALYDLLLQVSPSPVVTLNRAVALSRLHGCRAGLLAMAPLEVDPAMRSYQPYWAARLALAHGAGNADLTAQSLPVALGLTSDPAVRQWMIQRFG